MKTAIRGILTALCVLHAASFAVDGIAVSHAFRHSSCDYALAPESELNIIGGYELNQPGTILRSIIRDSQVERLDTIYNETFARFPVLDMKGTRIAFWRWDGRLDGDAIVDMDKNRYLSVMDTDGGNVKDLVTFALPDGVNYREFDKINLIDWPHGDWIYYQKPTTHEIWKVKYSDPSSNTHVYTYEHPDFKRFWRWDLSGAADRATLTANWTFGYSNIIQDFPPSYPPLPNTDKAPDGKYVSPCCCNICVSPGGGHLAYFANVAHSRVYYHEWASPDADNPRWHRDFIHLDSIARWVGKETLGGGMGMMRFSANSDKWLCLWVGGYRHPGKSGGNQVLFNWVDSTAIQITDNSVYPKNELCNGDVPVVYACTQGDFWVDGGAENRGKWEDVDGVWHQFAGVDIDASYPARRTAANARARRPRIGVHSIPGAGRGIYLIDGERVFTPRGRVLESPAAARIRK
jgi:hypothetical protein